MLKHHLTKGGYWAILKYILNFIRQILIVPLILTYWGDVQFGYWLVIMSIQSFIQTITIGYYQYVGNEINIVYPKSKSEAKKKFMGAIQVSLLLFVLQLIFLVFFSESNFLQDVFGVDSLMLIEFHLGLSVFFVAGSYAFLNIFLRFGLRLYEPISQLYKIYRIEFFFTLIIDVFAFVYLLNLQLSLLKFSIYYSALVFLFSIMIVLVLRKKFNFFVKDLFVVNYLKSGFLNYRNAFVFIFSNVFEKGLADGLPLIVSYLYGSLMLPVFATTKTIGNIFVSGTYLIGAVFIPQMQQQYAKQNFNGIIKHFTFFWSVLGFFTSVVIVILLPYFELLFRLWTRDKLGFNVSLFMLIISSVVCISFGAILTLFVKGINNKKAVWGQAVVRMILFATLFGFSNRDIVDVGIVLLATEVLLNFFLNIHIVNVELSAMGMKKVNAFFAKSIIPSLLLLSFILLFGLNILADSARVVFLIFLLLVYFVLYYDVYKTYLIKLKSSVK